jgi:predicted component of type VI protein secretion system
MTMQELLDFDVTIDSLSNGYRTQVVASPAGEAKVDFDLPFTDKDLEILILRVIGSIGRARRKVRRIESQERQLLEMFGSQLFKAAFAGPVRDCLARSRLVAENESAGLRIRLRLPPALANVPWEYLYDEEYGFVSLSPETAVVRYVEMPSPVRPFPVSPPLRILAMIPTPSDVPQLQGEEEWDKLKEALDTLTRRGMVLVDRLEVGSLSALQRPLRLREYHVLHFIGHAGYDEHAQDGALALEGADHETRLVTGRDLGLMIRGHRSLRLAVLNACEGARSAQDDPFGGVAQALVRQGIPAVIAMQSEISDPAALLFSQSFYQAIADGLPIDVATVEARRAMFAAGSEVEWATPVLYLRSLDGRIFTQDDISVGIGKDIEDAERNAQERAELRALQQEARSTGAAGDAAGARDRFAALLRTYEQLLGHENLDILQARAELAIWTGKAGDAAGARDQLRALVRTYERVLGPEHPDTLKVRLYSARWTGKAGDITGACDQLRALMGAYERVLGPEHPDTLQARARLATWTAKTGDAAKACDQLRALVRAYERVLGPDHPDTLKTRARLARWTEEAGDAAGCRDQYAMLLQDYERVLGPDHPDTLQVRQFLAASTFLAGDIAQGCDQLEALPGVFERALGPDHFLTLEARLSAGLLVLVTDESADTRHELAVLLQDHERILGRDHPDTLEARFAVANIIGWMGNPREARDQIAALLSTRSRVLGPEHPNTLETRARLAAWTGQAGDAAGARDQLAALLRDYERVLGHEHPKTLEIRSNLAMSTAEAGDAEAARDQLAALLRDYERMLGHEHPQPMATRRILAAFMGTTGDAAGARDELEVVLRYLERVLAPEDPTIVAVQTSLEYWTEKARTSE